MSTNVLSLGKEGKLEDPDLKIDYLMCTFFFSKDHQTTLFPGQIASLPKIIQMYGSNANNVREATERSLNAFLGKYFTTTAVEVTVEDTEPGINLQMNGIVSDTASITPSSYSIGYSLLIKDSKLKSILNIETNKDLLKT